MGISSYFKILMNFSTYVDKKYKYLNLALIFATIAAFLEVLFPVLLGIGAGILFDDSSGKTFLDFLRPYIDERIDPVLIFASALIVLGVLRYILIFIFFRMKYKFAMHYGYSIAEKTEHLLLDLDILTRRMSLNPDLARIIHSETNTITWKFFVPLIDLFYALSIILFSTLALLFISFEIFLLCIPLLAIAMLYYLVTGRSTQVSQDDDVNFRERLAIFAEIIQEGALDTVSQANKNWLKDKISSEFKNITNTQTKNILDALRPRPIIETLILVLLGILIITLYIIEASFFSSYLVGVLIFLRMLISIGQFHGSIVALKLGSSNAKNVLEILSPALSQNKQISMARNFVYKKSKKESFSVKFKNLIIGWNKKNPIKIDDEVISQGDLLVIFGPSGTGKTTLLRTVTTSLEPLDGKIIFTNFNPDFKEKEIFYVRQDPHIIPSTLIENLILDDFEIFLTKNKTSRKVFFKRVVKLLTDFGFDDVRAKSLLKENTINKSISGGEAQRIAILRLFFSHDVKLCLFDEPTASLDKKNIKHVANLIGELSKSKACIVITHDDFLIDLLTGYNSKLLKLYPSA